MGVTRRYLGEGVVVLTLAGLAVLFERPLLLVGAAGLGGWLLARQYRFVQTVSAVSDALAVDQVLPRDRVSVGDDVRVSLEAALPARSPFRIDVDANPPLGVETGSWSAVEESTSESDDTESADDEGPDDESPNGERSDEERPDGERPDERLTERPAVTLSVGEQSVTTAFTARCPIAGEFKFDPPTVTVTDPTGRFRTTFPAGPAPTMTVHARQPRNVHVGIGGNAQKAPYGDVTDPESDDRGSSLELAEVRPYVPGDSLRHVDWNATARFDQPHVREFEAETERRLAILLDCRATMATGTEGQTAFDYARQVALEAASYARDRGEPIDVFAVGESGLRWHLAADGAEAAYAAIERGLRSLEPETGESESFSPLRHSPAVARRRARLLREDGSSFGGNLRPFFEAADPYVQRISEDPLFGTAQSYVGRLRGSVTTLVLTDDEKRPETRETVRVARRRNDAAMALIAPTALFEPDGLADLDAAYDRYADFERFRQELARIERVSAFEVAPSERLSALLAATNRRRVGETA